MKIAIVGSEAAKFTRSGKAEALRIITELLSPSGSILVSGHCHLGGIDIWAEEIAKRLKRKTMIYPPKDLRWETGYKPRNIQIANACDEAFCVVVKRLPNSYTGMRFSFCYHCQSLDHVKSGACWTVKRAIEQGKPGHWCVVENLE